MSEKIDPDDLINATLDILNEAIEENDLSSVTIKVWITVNPRKADYPFLFTVSGNHKALAKIAETDAQS